MTQTHDEKIIMALHGAGMSAAVWERLAALLSPLNFQAVSLPAQGAGASIGALAEGVGASLEHHAPRSVLLIGHSMGALVALEAAPHPAVCAVVLLGAAATMPVHPDLLKKAKDAPQEAAALILKWGVAPENPAAAAFLRERMQPDALAAGLVACDAYVSGEKTARALQKPALVLSGEGDKLVKATASRALAEMMPRGRFCLFSACGHMPMAEKPVETARETKAFLAALEES